jgi:hypothetical protein
MVDSAINWLLSVSASEILREARTLQVRSAFDVTDLFRAMPTCALKNAGEV